MIRFEFNKSSLSGGGDTFMRKSDEIEEFPQIRRSKKFVFTFKSRTLKIKENRLVSFEQCQSRFPIQLEKLKSSGY